MNMLWKIVSPNLYNGVLEAAWMRDVVRKVNYLSPTI